ERRAEPGGRHHPDDERHGARHHQGDGEPPRGRLAQTSLLHALPRSLRRSPSSSTGPGGPHYESVPAVPPRRIVLQRSLPHELVDAVSELDAAGAGWVNVGPAVDEEDLPAPSGGL